MCEVKGMKYKGVEIYALSGNIYRLVIGRKTTVIAEYPGRIKEIQEELDEIFDILKERFKKHGGIK